MRAALTRLSIFGASLALEPKPRSSVKCRTGRFNSDCGHPSIDAVDGPGDVRRLVRREEKDHRRDLLGSAWAAQRDRRDDLRDLAGVLEYSAVHRSRSESWDDGVHSNAFDGVVRSHDTHKPKHTRFARAVRVFARGNTVERGWRSRADDRP